MFRTLPSHRNGTTNRLPGMNAMLSKPIGPSSPRKRAMANNNNEYVSDSEVSQDVDSPLVPSKSWFLTRAILSLYGVAVINEISSKSSM